MLLDAHGGAVAAGGHGSRRAVGSGGNGPLLVPGRRGASGRCLMQRARQSAALGRVRGAILCACMAAAALIDGRVRTKLV